MILYNKPKNTSGLGQDERDCLKYLCKKNHAYLMDNHLAAAWCWMKECDANEKYGFLHLDRHHDMCREGDTPQFCDVKGLSLEKYLGAHYTQQAPWGGTIKYPFFTWNTYITKCFDTFPQWFSSTALIVRQELGMAIRNLTPNFEYNLYNYHQGLKEIRRCLSDTSKKWIVNVDIDFFFKCDDPDSIGDEVKERYKDRTIRNFARLINQYSSNIQVLTVALSPECCGGMDHALEAYRIFESEIDLLKGIQDD